jgi:hypothetical protein
MKPETTTLTTHFIVARGPEVQKVRSLPELCGLRVSVWRTLHQRLPCCASVASGSDTRSPTVGTHPLFVACGEAHLSGECSNSKQQLKSCSCGCNHAGNYRGCSRWKEAKAALAKRGQTKRRQANFGTCRPGAPKSARPGPSVEQESLGPGWNHVVQEGRVVKVTVPTPPEHSPRSFTEPPE